MILTKLDHFTYIKNCFHRKLLGQLTLTIWLVKLNPVQTDLSRIISSVEVLDTGSNEWRAGPDLPVGVRDSQLVELPDGGVLLVAGFTGRTVGLKTLFKLSSVDTPWIALPQVSITPNIFNKKHIKVKNSTLGPFE